MRHSLHVSWRNVTENKKRFLFTLLAVISGVIIMTSMLIAKETTSKTLDYYEELYAGEANFFVQSSSHFFSEENVNEVTNDAPVEQEVRSLLKQSFVDIEGLDEAQSSVRISGVSSFDNGLLELPVIEGDLSKEGLVITENAAKLWDKKLGDSVRFEEMGSLPITAIVDEGPMLSSPETLEQATMQHVRVMAPLQTVQAWSGLEDQLTDYRFNLTEDVNHKTFLEDMQTKLKRSDLFIQPIVIDDRQNNDVEGLYWVFDIIAILSVFISGFIAFNMIYASVIERRKEFAIMKSLGYTNVKIARLVLQEIGLLAVLGTLIALPVGVWFGGVFQELLIGVIATENVTYTLEWRLPLIISASVGLLFPFIAAIFPVFQASKTPVMEAMVEHPVTKVNRKSSRVLRVVLGVLFTGIGFIDHPIVFLFLFVGLVLLYPLFLTGIRWVLTSLFKVVFKYPGQQAMRSVQQFNNRNANTSAMLAIGVSLALFMSALLISLPSGMEAEIRHQFGGDIHVTKETPWSDHDLQVIRDSKEITDANLFVEIPQITWHTEAGDGREFSVMGFSNKPEEAEMFRITEETSEPSSFPYLYLGERAMAEWGGQVGDTMRLNTPAGEQDFFVKASIESTHYTDYVGFLSESDIKAVLDWPSIYNVAISVKHDTSAPFVMDDMWNTFGSELVHITAASQVAERSKQALNGMEELLQGLLLLVIVISAIGISNTLFMNILERTKEIGMMRAIGFTKGQVRLMIMAEGLLIGVAGVIVGVGYGILVIYLNAQSEKELLTFTIPGASLLLAIVGGLLFTWIATWLPTISASRVSVKEAISHE